MQHGGGQMTQLTESHPGLPQVQVHSEVRLEAKVHQGDVRARLSPES